MDLTTKTEEELFILFTNCRNVLEDNAARHRHQTAQEIITKIETEWDRRIKESESGNYRTTRPTKGMMSRLGYRVGEAGGITESARRKILDFVMTERLPFFHSPMYVREWGEPRTKERFQKLIHFFEGMLNGRYTGDVDRAMDEWSQDLDYVKRTYTP